MVNIHCIPNQSLLLNGCNFAAAVVENFDLAARYYERKVPLEWVEKSYYTDVSRFN